LDSYSCVGMVSESTLISIPLNGLAALMNHSISFICCALLRVDGWNSLSTHFFASFTPPSASGENATITAAAASDARSLPNVLMSPPLSSENQVCPTTGHPKIESKRMSI